MRLHEFITSLRPHEASIAVALLELMCRASPDGVLDRGEWMAAVRSTHSRLRGEARLGGLQDLDRNEGGSYLEDHILSRLAAEEIAFGEPRGPGWERVRINPGLWAHIGQNWESVVADLERAVRDLLVEPQRHAHAIDEVENGRVANGSTLSTRGLVKVYRKRRVVAEVELSVSQGEIVGLLGPNGAGKTTTFYMIVGLISPDEGQVFLDDEELTRVPMFKRARRGIGYLAQEPSIFRKLTVEQNIMAILETMRLPRSERRARLETLLDELGIRHLRKAKAYSLSGGERRRLEITRALVSQPKFMLLDEPFAGVDPIAVHDIQQIVAALRHRGIGLVITDHNVEQTLDIVDRAYIMYDGRVRVSGSVAELVWNEEVAEIYFGPTLTARMRERYRRPELPG